MYIWLTLYTLFLKNILTFPSFWCLIGSIFSPQNWPQQSTIAKGFAEVNSVYIVITLAKILLRWLFSSKIYIQFTIFNTYFSTKLLFANKRYHLHQLEKHLYVLQEVRSIILFILFLFVQVAMEQALLSHLISSYQQNSVTSHF